MDITGVGQEELVCMLRSTRQGEGVSLVVLRQEDMFLPREMVRANVLHINRKRCLFRGSLADCRDNNLLSILFCFHIVVFGPINRPAWMMHDQKDDTLPCSIILPFFLT